MSPQHLLCELLLLLCIWLACGICSWRGGWYRGLVKYATGKPEPWMSAIVRYSAQPSNKLDSVCPNNLVRLKSDTSLFSLAFACPPISEEILSNFKFGKNLDEVFRPRSLLVIFAVGDIHLIFDDGENGFGVRSHFLFLIFDFWRWRKWSWYSVPFPILFGQARQRSSPTRPTKNNDKDKDKDNDKDKCI